MPSLFEPRPCHIITYGTLLGSNLFQTFLAGPFAYKALPRAQFSTLQQAIFPPYFCIQTALPVLLALSWPGERIAALGVKTAVNNPGIRGLLAQENGLLWTVTTPILLMFASSAINLIWLGPLTTKVMKERKHQETRDGKKYYDPGSKSDEMQKLNLRFGILHGAASLLNVIGLGAMLAYGFTLAEKL